MKTILISRDSMAKPKHFINFIFAGNACPSKTTEQHRPHIVAEEFLPGAEMVHVDQKSDAFR